MAFAGRFFPAPARSPPNPHSDMSVTRAFCRDGIISHLHSLIPGLLDPFSFSRFSAAEQLLGSNGGAFYFLGDLILTPRPDPNSGSATVDGGDWVHEITGEKWDKVQAVDQPSRQSGLSQGFFLRGRSSENPNNMTSVLHRRNQRKTWWTGREASGENYAGFPISVYCTIKGSDWEF